ncbi:hypothetical protein ARM72_15380 [Listeria monocytogenes]|nr:hypothetical protein [Listeria monocytogenes]
MGNYDVSYADRLKKRPHTRLFRFAMTLAISTLIGVPSANGEFVSIRRFPLISPVILYNKECFQNNSKNQLDNSGN